MNAFLLPRGGSSKLSTPTPNRGAWFALCGALSVFAACAPKGVPNSAPDSGTCVPTCRPGFVCVAGACEAACNPRCAVGQTCTADLQCVAFGVDAGTDSSDAAPLDAPDDVRPADVMVEAGKDATAPGTAMP